MLNTSIIILVLFVLAFGGFAVYDLATARRRREVYRVKSSLTAYLMLLPSVALAFLFVLLPILYSLGYAFTDYYLLRPNNINFIELQNFRDFFDELATKGKAVIVISSELPELLGVCDRIYVMSEGRITGALKAENATQEDIMKLASIPLPHNISERNGTPTEKYDV